MSGLHPPFNLKRINAGIDDYVAALRAAEATHDDGDDWLLSWGYHRLWHGRLDRRLLDEVSSTRPIGIWQRSCHEWYLNSVAIGDIRLYDLRATILENMSGDEILLGMNFLKHFEIIQKGKVLTIRQ